MNILMKMYQGSFVLEPDNIGHEWINLIKAEDGRFYIWLNSNGHFDDKKLCGGRSADILMVKTISDGIYSVVGKAVGCVPVHGSNHKKIKSADERRRTQSDITYSYNNQSWKLADIYNNEKDLVATFVTDKVFKPKKPVFVTPNDEFVNNKIYFKLSITAKSSMRQYFDRGVASSEFKKIINNPEIWEEETSKGTIEEFIGDQSNLFKSKETMFSILKKEDDEVAISNSIAYFLKKYGLAAEFLHSLEKNLPLTETYEIYREQNDIDLLFIGSSHIAVIENKIYSGINGLRKNADFETQIDAVLKNDYLTQLIEEASLSKTGIKDQILKWAASTNNASITSQLSKYAIVALIIACCKGIQFSNVHFFLLMPEFEKAIYQSNFFENYACFKSYYIKGYDEVFNFFKTVQTAYHDIYFEDFLNVIAKYAKNKGVYESHLAAALKNALKKLELEKEIQKNENKETE